MSATSRDVVSFCNVSRLVVSQGNKSKNSSTSTKVNDVLSLCLFVCWLLLLLLLLLTVAAPKNCDNEDERIIAERLANTKTPTTVVSSRG